MSNILLSNMNDTLKNLNGTLKTTNNRLDLLAISSAGDLNNPTTMARLVRSGLGELAYPIGSQITVPHSEYGDLVFDVVAHNWHKNPDDESAPTMTLLMHDTIPDIAFDAAEMLWANTGTTALPAGTYNFTLYKSQYDYRDGSTGTDGTYQFTTTKAIPYRGGWRHSTAGAYGTKDKAGITKGTITTYDASGNTLETNLVVTEGSEGTALGTTTFTAKAYCVNLVGQFNCTFCSHSGSGDWAVSDARQWLNSSSAAGKWWRKQSVFDLPASFNSKAGFLNGLDKEFYRAIGAVDTNLIANELWSEGHDPGSAYTVQGTFFTPYMKDLWGIDGSEDAPKLPAYAKGFLSVYKYPVGDTTSYASYWMLDSTPQTLAGCACAFVPSNGFPMWYDCDNTYSICPECVVY